MIYSLLLIYHTPVICAIFLCRLWFFNCSTWACKWYIFSWVFLRMRVDSSLCTCSWLAILKTHTADLQYTVVCLRCCCCCCAAFSSRCTWTKFRLSRSRWTSQHLSSKTGEGQTAQPNPTQSNIPIYNNRFLSVCWCSNWVRLALGHRRKVRLFCIYFVQYSCVKWREPAIRYCEQGAVTLFAIRCWMLNRWNITVMYIVVFSLFFCFFSSPFRSHFLYVRTCVSEIWEDRGSRSSQWEGCMIYVVFSSSSRVHRLGYDKSKKGQQAKRLSARHPLIRLLPF